jgi:hypothetical protein
MTPDPAQHTEVAEQVARRAAWKFGGHPSEWIGVCWIGMRTASHRYDPQRGTPEAFFYTAAWSAAYDEARKMGIRQIHGPKGRRYNGKALARRRAVSISDAPPVAVRDPNPRDAMIVRETAAGLLRGHFQSEALMLAWGGSRRTVQRATGRSKSGVLRMVREMAPPGDEDR